MSRTSTACRTRPTSCSNPNSGVWTPMTISPSSRYARDHARTYGSWRSQLMHVSVQKFTSTTCPGSSAGPSGSELSHPVAPSSEGMWTREKTAIGLAKRPERRSQLVREDLRLLPGSEVTAPVDLVEVDEIGIGALGPAPRRPVLLAREDGYGDRDVHALGVEEAALVLPVEPGRGDPCVRQPVERDVVEDLVPRQLAGRALRPLESGSHRGGRLAVGIVVVEQPGGKADG